MLSKFSSDILQNHNSVTDYTINLPSPESWIKARNSNLTILVFVLFTWWQVQFSQTFAFICFFKNSDFNISGQKFVLWWNPEFTKKKLFWKVWSLLLPLQTATLGFSCIFKRFFSKLRQTPSSCQALCFCISVSPNIHTLGSEYLTIIPLVLVEYKTLIANSTLPTHMQRALVESFC